ncbi:bifunctional P-450:NADPH-P450 reductase [Xylaria sp. FL1777]|nr:bifunctional P-450:NADPH-P450 reductase [Xylaria sp. FL1777]
MATITPIPSPPTWPLVGNATQIDPVESRRSFSDFADKYGEVFRIYLPGGRSIVFANSHRLINELCDEKRFAKIPNGVLEEIRNGVHDGLFTAKPGEEAWGIAHRVLMPASVVRLFTFSQCVVRFDSFIDLGGTPPKMRIVILTFYRFGPLSIRGMFEEMHDVATQMALKFARYGPKTPIPASEDFTRLALDTLALCSMGFRFNSFYSKEMHPMIEAMGGFLVESGKRPTRVLPSFFYRADDAKYWNDIAVLRDTAQEVLEARKKNPENRKDLLNAMLNGVDPKTGKHMSDSSIIDNLITFLIAGHETTSGTLSFAFYRLLKNPEAYQKVQKEVDEVIGKGPINVEHLSKLPYITAVLRETLRLDSPIPIFGVVSLEDQLLGGRYPVSKDEPCSLFLTHVHIDPAVWGDDAHDFKPERMLDGAFSKLPKNAWKPFGNGARGCIGRPFAMQEAILAMAVLFQSFNFVLHDPTYNLAIKQTLTIKPDNFLMRAIIRDGLSPTQLEHRLAGRGFSQESSKLQSEESSDSKTEGQRITVLYGSNSGTCEALAQRVASDASRHGFTVDKVDCLDTANGAIPKNQPVIIITASYEGEPPDNAALFCSWLTGVKDKNSLAGVDYAVFGVGHHDWVQTFHRIPKLVDAKLEENGAARIADLGLSDTGSTDTFTDFETWEDNILWPALHRKYGTRDAKGDALQSAGLSVEITSPRTSTLRQDVMEGLVVSTHKLTAEGEPVKKHIEIALPSGQTYRSGDYLAVLPINPKGIVQRVMRRFQLPWDAHITIGGAANTPLPTSTSMPAQSVFSAYVELAQPATKRNILSLAETAKDDADKDALKKYANQDYPEVLDKRISVLDLLEKFPAIELPLGLFLAMLPPMRVRQYSISSSPLWNPAHVTLTFSVLEAPSKSGNGTHVGVASSYLDSLEPGDKLHVAVRKSHAAFHLPQNPENTPVICIGAGTGISPFRGFIQERAEMIAAGRKLAPAILLVGCRAPGRDDLYADELVEWEKAGAVTVKRAYSRATDKSNGAKYVQDLIPAYEDEIVPLWEQNAKLYICGSRAIGEGVKAGVVKMVLKRAKEHGNEEASEESITQWWEELRNVRYATDVFD